MMVHESKHPIIQHKLALLRSSETKPKQFRELVRELAAILCYEATADLPLNPIKVQTPMGEANGMALQEQLGLVPILRAGLGMVEGLLDMLPALQVWHLGMYRNEETLEPVWYYNKLPSEPKVDMALVLDPMLATGGSAIATVDVVKRWGVKRVKFLGLIAAPEGIEALHAAHPDVPIHVAAIDSHLNEIGFIVPGLGDAGDRQFGTE
ncbi:MAG: uracil phosphoribosyltransferase [Chloroflexota bacterium]